METQTIERNLPTNHHFRASLHLPRMQQVRNILNLRLLALQRRLQIMAAWFRGHVLHFRRGHNALRHTDSTVELQSIRLSDAEHTSFLSEESAEEEAAERYINTPTENQADELFDDRYMSISLAGRSVRSSATSQSDDELSDEGHTSSSMEEWPNRSSEESHMDSARESQAEEMSDASPQATVDNPLEIIEPAITIEEIEATYFDMLELLQSIHNNNYINIDEDYLQTLWNEYQNKRATLALVQDAYLADCAELASLQELNQDEQDRYLEDNAKLVAVQPLDPEQMTILKAKAMSQTGLDFDPTIAMDPAVQEQLSDTLTEIRDHWLQIQTQKVELEKQACLKQKEAVLDAATQLHDANTKIQSYIQTEQEKLVQHIEQIDNDFAEVNFTKGSYHHPFTLSEFNNAYHKTIQEQGNLADFKNKYLYLPDAIGAKQLHMIYRVCKPKRDTEDPDIEVFCCIDVKNLHNVTLAFNPEEVLVCDIVFRSKIEVCKWLNLNQMIESELQTNDEPDFKLNFEFGWGSDRGLDDEVDDDSANELDIQLGYESDNELDDDLAYEANAESANELDIQLDYVSDNELDDENELDNEPNNESSNESDNELGYESDNESDDELADEPDNVAHNEVEIDLESLLEPDRDQFSHRCNNPLWQGYNRDLRQ